MIELKLIKESEIQALILLSYEGDCELFDKYHITKMTFQEAVDTELSMIRKNAKNNKFIYYKVLYDNISIGYVVSLEKFIYSFAIAIKYRTKEVLTHWWDAMVNEFGNEIKFGILSNNKRAISYLENRGMKIVWENPQMNNNNEILLTF